MYYFDIKFIILQWVLSYVQHDTATVTIQRQNCNS